MPQNLFDSLYPVPEEEKVHTVWFQTLSLDVPPCVWHMFFSCFRENKLKKPNYTCGYPRLFLNTLWRRYSNILRSAMDQTTLASTAFSIYITGFLRRNSTLVTLQHMFLGHFLIPVQTAVFEVCICLKGRVQVLDKNALWFTGYFKQVCY